MGKPRNSLAGCVRHRRQAVEPRQAKRAAQQINRGDEPAPFRVPAKHIVEHHPVHQEGRRHPEGDQVGQRVELAPKRAFHPAHPRHPAVKQVKDARQQNEPQRHFDLLEIAVRDVGLDDLGQRHKPAEQVGRREQVRQEIDLQLRLARAVERGNWEMGVSIAGLLMLRPRSLKHRQHGFAPDDTVAQLHFDLALRGRYTSAREPNWIRLMRSPRATSHPSAQRARCAAQSPRRSAARPPSPLRASLASKPSSTFSL